MKDWQGSFITPFLKARALYVLMCSHLTHLHAHTHTQFQPGKETPWLRRQRSLNHRFPDKSSCLYAGVSMCALFCQRVIFVHCFHSYCLRPFMTATLCCYAAINSACVQTRMHKMRWMLSENQTPPRVVMSQVWKLSSLACPSLALPVEML